MVLFNSYKQPTKSLTPDQVQIHPHARVELVEAIDSLLAFEATNSASFDLSSTSIKRKI